MEGYNTWLQISDRKFFECMLSEETLRKFDDTLRGQGLPPSGSILIRMSDGKEIVCTDLLVEFQLLTEGR